MTLDTLDRPDYTGEPLPPWVTRLRPHQVRAVNKVVDAFEDVDLVILDAPVGSGKTLIGELVRRELKVKGLYVCTDRALQDQVLRDFSYAKVLKGRSNYIPQLATGSITCDDCNISKGVCQWCSYPTGCPYRVAKENALAADLAVLNTSMFLSSANYPRFFIENELVIADECDLLEEALIKFIEFEVPQWLGKALALEYPVKAARKTTIINWLKDFRERLDGDKALMLAGDPKKKRAIDGLSRAARELVDALSKDLASGDVKDDDEDIGHWVRDYETQTFRMRPVTVNRQAPRKLWMYGDKWLLMSGTVVSAEELVESLGWQGDYRVVTVPSTFPVENRMLTVAPVADMTRRAGDRDWPKVVTAIERILAEREGRALVHTVSYALTRYLATHLKTGHRRLFYHTDARGKQGALQAFQNTPNAVLLSPSCQRGVDLFDELCRIQIICKTPFPSLGDRQVSSRLRLPGGDLWYAVKTARDVVQMTGRGVRSKDDWCLTYVLDQQFPKNIWRKYKHLFTEAFKESVDMKADVRWLL